MANKTDANLTSGINTNINDNTSGDITPADLRGELLNLTDSKINNDKISTDLTADAASTTKVPSVKIVKDVLDTKQATLVSGTNIKTINGATVLGSGDIVISGGGGGTGDASTNTSSSVDGEVVLFSGTGGKTLKRSTLTGIAKVTAGVQGIAVSGTDIKTVNGASLLGSGNLEITPVAGAWVPLTIAATTPLTATTDTSYQASSALLNVTFTLPNLADNGEVVIRYEKTTSSNVNLTFPTGSSIRDDNGTLAGLTAVLTGLTTTARFLVAIKRDGSTFIVIISKYKD